MAYFSLSSHCFLAKLDLAKLETQIVFSFSDGTPTLWSSSSCDSHHSQFSCSFSEDHSIGDNVSNNFCIIEGPESLGFFQMQLQEIQENIRSRRSKIFLLMEEGMTKNLKEKDPCYTGSAALSYDVFMSMHHLMLRPQLLMWWALLRVY